MKTKKRKAQLPELTDAEKNVILPILLELLKKKTSPSNRIHGKKITEFFRKKKEAGQIDYPNVFNETRLHKLINYIRIKELLPVCASSNGYWCNNKSEDELVDSGKIYEAILLLDEKIESAIDTAESLEGRIEAIAAAAKGMRNMANDFLLKRKLLEEKINFLQEKEKRENDLFYMDLS